MLHVLPQVAPIPKAGKIETLVDLTGLANTIWRPGTGALVADDQRDSGALNVWN